jgi:hypothetical protein
MKIQILFFLIFISNVNFSQCEITIEEIVKFESMSNSEIETFTLEKGMSKFEEGSYVCDKNNDFLMVDKNSSFYSYITTDKLFYLDFKKHVENETDLNKEEVLSGVTYYTYLYKKYELGICEIMFNSGISESGKWEGTIHVIFLH